MFSLFGENRCKVVNYFSLLGNLHCRVANSFPSWGKCIVRLQSIFPRWGKCFAMLQKVFPDEGKHFVTLRRVFPLRGRVFARRKRLFVVLRRVIFALRSFWRTVGKMFCRLNCIFKIPRWFVSVSFSGFFCFSTYIYPFFYLITLQIYSIISYNPNIFI